MPEITQQEMDVIEAARVLAADFADHEAAGGELDMNGKELLNAVRALGPKPVGRLERGAYLDKDGQLCWADGDGWVGFPGVEGMASPYAAAQYGPFTRLVPESETVPVDLARRLAEHAADLLIAAEEGKPALPSTLHLARSVIGEVEFALPKEAE